MHRSTGWIGSGLLGLAFLAGIVTAQTPAPTPRNQLPALARSMAESFKPVGTQEHEAARASLQAAMDALERAFDASGAANTQRWKDLLNWQTLEQQVMRPEGPDAAEMQDVIKTFTGNLEGTERRDFVAVREQLQNFRRVAVIAAEQGLPKAVPLQIEKLAAALEAYEANPSGEAAAEVGRLVGWLQRHEQLRPLITSIQRHYLIPNLEIQFSERFLGAMQQNRHIDRVQPVNDVIQGTHVCGHARLVGDTTLDMVPSQKHALGNALVRGMVSTQTVGTQRGVTIYSHGGGPVCAVKPIVFTPASIYGLPATASSNTHNHIDDIQARHRFVERIAWRRAGKQMPAAEAEANAKTSSRLKNEVDEESVGMIANMNSQLNKALRSRLIRRGVEPYWEHYSSSHTHLLVHWLSMGKGQLGSPTQPPTLAQQHDVDVRVQESTVANFGEQIVGGVKLTSKRMKEIEAEIEKRKSEVRYASKGVIATRDEELAVDIDYNDPIAPRTVIRNKVFLRKRFARVLPKRIDDEPIVLPPRMAHAGYLAVQHIQSHGDWMSVGLGLMPGAPAVALPATTAEEEMEEDDDDNRDWSITFTWEQPIQVRIKPDGFQIMIRATELSRTEDNGKEEAIRGDIRITANYRFGDRREELPKPGAEDMAAARQFSELSEFED